jgi:hypothetical protein
METINKQLHSKYFFDKVLHKYMKIGFVCNTLSGWCCAYQIQNKSSSCFSFQNTVMLDDRTPFTRTELFHRIGQTVS